MGTRNLTIVIADGATRIAQYGQWDGYPSGQGATILAFLKKLTPAKLAKFRKKLRLNRWATDNEIKKGYKDSGADDSGFVGMDVVQRFEQRFPTINRDLGGKILEMTLEADHPLVLRDETAFAADSLFCEWAYVVDLDKKRLEVYRGFNKQPLTKKDRFYHLQNGSSGEYAPVKLAKSYPFSKLPTPSKMGKDCAENDDE